MDLDAVGHDGLVQEIGHGDRVPDIGGGRRVVGEALFIGRLEHPGHRRVGGGDPVEHGLVEGGRVGHVERHHDMLDRRPEHDPRRLRVEPPVEFCRGRHIARHLDRPAHVDDPLDQRDDLGRRPEGQSEVGERADGEDRHLVRIGLDGVDEESHRVLVADLHLLGEAVRRGREIVAALGLRLAPGARIALAVERLLRLERGGVVQQRIIGAGMDLDLAGEPHPLDRALGIGDLLQQPLVAADHGDAQKVDLPLLHRLGEHDEGLTVIAHGVEVGVEDHLLLGQGDTAQADETGGDGGHDRATHDCPPRADVALRIDQSVAVIKPFRPPARPAPSAGA